MFCVSRTKIVGSKKFAGKPALYYCETKKYVLANLQVSQVSGRFAKGLTANLQVSQVSREVCQKFAGKPASFPGFQGGFPKVFRQTCKFPRFDMGLRANLQVSQVCQRFAGKPATPRVCGQTCKFPRFVKGLRANLQVSQVCQGEQT